MLVTQKNQYALRAVFELAKHRGKGPIKIAEIADAQSIPLRFLEVILSQLKRNGLVQSKRGYTGGYFVEKSPDDITVGDVFRSMDESLGPIECIACGSKDRCPFQGSCVFFPMWERVQSAIHGVFENTTIKDLLKEDAYDSITNVNCCT